MSRGRIVVALLLLTGIGQTQDNISADRETIRLLVQQVKELQEEVKALQAKQANSAVATGEMASAPSKSREEAANPQAMGAAAQVLHEVRGIQWRGFGEVNYKVLDQRPRELGMFGFTPGSAGNFYTGDFDLFLTSNINNRASVLAEIVFGEGQAQTFDVDVERLLLKYDYNDHLKLSFGRYHTGIGYYNTAFHSGKWLQTTADRPLVMEFAADGGLLPTHAVGVSATGLIPSGPLGLNYVLEYGSSDTVRPDIDGSGHIDDQQNSNHVVVGLFARPDALAGLQIGTSFYHDKITHENLGIETRFDQTIVNAHVVYTAQRYEILNEGFWLRHAPENSQTIFNTAAFYSQFSKRFHRTWPFFRYQYVNAGEGGIYEDVLLRHGPSVGARYDFNDNIAFKLQLDHTIRKGKADLNGLQTQLAFTF
jgi:hypothetical protein